MQTENLAINSHKQFHILLNTNQIRLYTCPDLLKENPLLRKFLNSESTACFSDEIFYHTHILLFSMTISAAIVIKATKHNKYYIIYNSCDVATKWSIITTEKSNVILPGSVDKNNVYFHMACLLPKHWKLLPLSHTLIDDAVKHKMAINN